MTQRKIGDFITAEGLDEKLKIEEINIIHDESEVDMLYGEYDSIELLSHLRHRSVTAYFGEFYFNETSTGENGFIFDFQINN